jgi:hypothetical protein
MGVGPLFPRNAPLVRQVFERYSAGDQTIEKISQFLQENGAITRGGKPFKRDKIKWILQNPFYYGHFRYNGELYEGRHEPIITKSLYDKVQAVIEKRGHKEPPHKSPQELCGLLRCSCGMAITTEKKVKVQKNGNRHEYIYYRCTRKNPNVRCVEPAVRSEILEKQISNLLLEYSPKSAVISTLENMITDTKRAETGKNSAVIADFSDQIARLERKQQILLDTFLDQDIDRQTFLEKKAEVMSEKQTLKESLAELSHNANCWVEPGVVA